MGTYARRYLWERDEWPEWRYDLGQLADGLASVSRAQGVLYGRLTDVGQPLREQASLEVRTRDVVATSAIEGEELNPVVVRTAMARRLGIDVDGVPVRDPRVDGVVAMALDATTHPDDVLTLDRMYCWHTGLFPAGHAGSTPERVGALRDDRHGPMQVVSGPIGHQRVHFEAPPAARLPVEVGRFLAWLNAETGEPALIKAGLAHLWLVTLHPFEDGSGRIARAVGDLMLARADRSRQRFYSMSSQIYRERKAYYEILERTQHGGLDVTLWLDWFLEMLGESVDAADRVVDGVLGRAAFWNRWGEVTFNERQVKVINQVLDGPDHQLTTRKWARVARTSQDTALRDINQLLARGVLVKNPGRGRSASYALTGLDRD